MSNYRRCFYIDCCSINTRTYNRDAGTGSNSGSEAPQVLSPVLQPLALLSQALAQASKPISLHGIVLAPGGSKRKESKVGQHSSADGEENATAVPLKDTPVLPQESGI